MLNNIQKNKIKKNLSWKNLILFFLWIVIFMWINIYFNDLLVVWLWFLEYENYIKIPYIIFGILDTILIALSINLLIDKLKEIKSLNPSAWLFSMIGTFIALLTWACPWCIAWIFPTFMWIFGSNISMYSLPFHWTELQVLSFIFLIIWIFYLSLDMTCKIKIKKEKIQNRIKLFFILIWWIIWTINATYLTIQAYNIKDSLKVFGGSNKNIWFACDLNSTFSCSSVFKEDFAWMFWIPFSEIALAVYPIVAIIAILALFWKIKNHFKYLIFLSIWWILFNWYIIYNEQMVWTYCLLCLACTAIIITIWILSIVWLKNKNAK